MKASVLIPTKNGGNLLHDVIRRVLTQSTPWDYEVLVLDSGTTDGSLDALKTQQAVQLHEIPAADFNHGSARNRLADLSRGDYLVYLTQDALPNDEHWLRNLVDAVDADPEIAGAFGRHIAHEGAGVLTKVELDEHFRGFGPQTTVYQIESYQRFDADVGYRQFLHFFSNNNSCIRRSVWASIRFPDVNFAEDQAWALAALRAGWKKAYVPTAVVAHSHEFGVIETFKRAYDEASAFKSNFGYVLQTDIFSVARNAAYLMRRNRQWLASHARGSVRVVERAKLQIAALARLLGQYAGSHYQNIPPSVRPYLSRDLSLRRE